jgi:hypothetical protein
MRRLNGRVVILAGLIAAYTGSMITASQRTAASMASAATAFLASLPQAERERAILTFDTDERYRWHYLPVDQFPRKGLSIKRMNEQQRELAHTLVKTGLSQRGFMTVSAIMDLEKVLKVLEQGRGPIRDSEEYYVSVFGTPSATAPWGWRVDGHHVSLHFTVAHGDAIATTPTFLGANPAVVRDGPQKGLRVLAAEEDAARALLDSMQGAVRSAAIIANVAPGDILTTNSMKVDPLAPIGVKASAMSGDQRERLMKLIEVYASVMTDNLAAERLARLKKAGLDEIAFAWAGDTERGRKHYYRIQGPTFLIEYDNTQNDANHIHTVWRDFDGDFGRDLLREHLKSMPH